MSDKLKELRRKRQWHRVFLYSTNFMAKLTKQMEQNFLVVILKSVRLSDFFCPAWHQVAQKNKKTLFSGVLYKHRSIGDS